MAKSAHDDVLDNGIQYIKDNCNLMTLCEGEPTTYEHANSNKGVATGKRLAGHVMASGDFTLAAGDTSGRKITVAAQSGVDVDVAGTADHVALVDTTNTKLLLVTTLSASKVVATDDQVNFGEFDDEIADPS